MDSFKGKYIKSPPDITCFNPDQLDTDQWIQAAKSLEATYALLTARRPLGFTLFPDPEYAYSIDKSPFQEGEGDIVRDFIASCHKFGIKPGLYYSCEANSFLNIHRTSGNMPTYPSEKLDYFTELVTRHLTYLWSNYGKLFEIWFDGGLLEHGSPYLELLRQLIPDSDVQSIQEFGIQLKNRFAQPLKAIKGKGDIIEIKFETESSFNNFEIMEDISEGHCVRSFLIEISENHKQWTEIFPWYCHWAQIVAMAPLIYRQICPIACAFIRKTSHNYPICTL